MLEGEKGIQITGKDEENSLENFKVEGVFSPMKLFNVAQRDYFETFKGNPIRRNIIAFCKKNFKSQYSGLDSAFVLNTLEYDIKDMVLNTLNEDILLDETREGKTTGDIYKELQRGELSNLKELSKRILDSKISKSKNLYEIIDEKLQEPFFKSISGEFNSQQIIPELVETIIKGKAQEVPKDLGKRLAIQIGLTSKFDESLSVPNQKGNFQFTLEDGKTKISVPRIKGNEYKNYSMLTSLSTLYSILKMTGREEDMARAKILEPKLSKLSEKYKAIIPELDKRYLKYLEELLAKKQKEEGKSYSSTRIVREIDRTKKRIEDREQNTSQELTIVSEHGLIKYTGNRQEGENSIVFKGYDLGPLWRNDAIEAVDGFYEEKARLESLGINKLSKYEMAIGVGTAFVKCDKEMQAPNK